MVQGKVKLHSKITNTTNIIKVTKKNIISYLSGKYCKAIFLILFYTSHLPSAVSVTQLGNNSASFSKLAFTWSVMETAFLL